MERCGAPGAKSNIEGVEWIRPRIHATPIQIDHCLKGRTVHLEKRTDDAVARVNFILLVMVLTVIHRIERERMGKEEWKRPRAPWQQIVEFELKLR